ncbi:Permease of the drug/metabolite transporter (DMT) superfamily [Fibrobacter sp. UWCM]|uniref:DMT family transporter n=1 Tax=Fibrobacter sp. UWCM TaxID=1896208 RepID=UPI00091EEB20|nr:DMT family transporter [Fibrobacter sp. UWCM]SHG28896.1 Permease of the drug/metabolite transporter (DMT) superfamily [Fibrobacter sp. UWCM]
MDKNVIAIVYAIAAAAFYALNVPCSKMLLAHISPVFMAGLLYIGAGLGIGILYLFHIKHEPQSERLCKKDFPYTLGMVLLDIAAPILLMFGVKYGTSSNASLLGNFEIVATTLVALFIFREKVSKRLWIAILFITLSSFILSFENADGFNFSIGSIFVLGATICWGLENNCTRKISDKSTYQIVTIKGLCSGIGSIVVSLTTGEMNFATKYIPLALLIGFVAYGLSIFTYIRAQKYLGAAKTSAFYAFAPFIGVLFSVVLLNEKITLQYIVAFLVMIAGTIFVVCDTLVRSHSHMHQHIFTHTHGGITHTHVVTHSHLHNHVFSDAKHSHSHNIKDLEKISTH